MTCDDPIKNLIAAAEKMDKWLFQSCRASRFRRLVSHGLPAQDLHDALVTVRDLTAQMHVDVDFPPEYLENILNCKPGQLLILDAFKERKAPQDNEDNNK